MRAEEIIDKLRPALHKEGLEVDFLGREGSVVNIRARRVSPGVPVAFLMKAVAGTFKRYMPEIEDVCLVDYDPGEGIAIAPSPTFEPVLKHKHKPVKFSLVGLPVVNLKGLNRKDAICAIEGFMKIWATRSPLVGFIGLEEDAPGRAAGKWASVYRDDFISIEEVSESRWEVLLQNDSSHLIEELRSKGDEVMPGSIFIMGEVAE